MKLTFKTVPPASEDFAPKDERFTGFELSLASDRRGVSAQAWPASKGTKMTFNGLVYVNNRVEMTIVGWSGFRIDMLPDLGIEPSAFVVEGETEEGATPMVDFDRHSLVWMLSNSPLFDKLASKAVQLHHGDEEVDDEEQEEENRKND